MQQLNDRCFIFVGPTGFGVNETLVEGLNVRPPIKRGDISELISVTTAPGTIIVVDGTFHVHPSVGHNELLTAINQGWVVWGLSSMGAIRATEMESYGMRGYGKVFDCFKNESFDDDEVTLLHENTYPYTNFTEPMIHIREFLNHAVDGALISIEVANSILKEMKETWYGYRTINKLKLLLQKYSTKNSIEKFEHLLNYFHPYRLKTVDYVSFLTAKLWLQ